MSKELEEFIKSFKHFGNCALDVIELLMLTRGASDTQRAAADSYTTAFNQQRGKPKEAEEWKLYYNGVKKRLIN